MSIQVSLFASSVRPQLYESLFKSLEGTSVEYEVVFAGNLENKDLMNKECENSGISFERPIHINIDENENEYITFFKYIKTKNLKPAQCYEIARRNCRGECVVWVADDCEFPNDVIGKAYKYWKSQNNEKLILSIQTKESGYGAIKGQLFNMDNHRFFGSNKSTPLMAPLGLMSRKFLNDLGGIDRRYVCGQYENQIVMMAYANGGSVEIFGDEHCFIDIDHLGKSIAIGESKDERDFLNRPFATGYEKDREILEQNFFSRRRISYEDYTFEPYEDKDLLIKSQSNKGKWE
jgi:hypothetical protein